MKYSQASREERRQRREQYVDEQKGLCYFCKTALKTTPVRDRKITWRLFPPNFLKYPVHLHHCHKTDETIGAVHAYCNAVLWEHYGE